MHSAFPPVSSSLFLTPANSNVVTIATDCTLSHPVVSPLIVSARRCSRQGQFQSQTYWSDRKDGQTENCVATVRWVRACLQSGHKCQHWCGFVYSCLQNARCMAVSVSVFVEWRTQ